MKENNAEASFALGERVSLCDTIQTDLELLPGIGSKTAKKLQKDFVRDFRELKGIGEKKASFLEKYLSPCASAHKR